MPDLRDDADPDRYRGLYDKFVVTRMDGRHRAGEKHQGCRYFVIDLDHDEFAAPAIEAYADACAVKYERLARDLRVRAKVIRANTFRRHTPGAEVPE